MRRLFAALALLAFAAGAEGAVVVATGEGIAVATDGRIELNALTGEVADRPGLRFPHFKAQSESGSRAAVFDPVDSRVALFGFGEELLIQDLADAPTDATFIGESLFILSREGATLTRLDASGARTIVPIPSGASMLAEGGGELLTYDPVRGRLGRYDAATLGAIATVDTDRFASDLEVVDGRLWLAIPRRGELVSFALTKPEEKRTTTGGAVPVDLAVEREGGLLGAGSLAVADPSSKRIWRVGNEESTGAAFARGFLRGLIGLGLYSSGSVGIPGQVDRVEAAGGTLLGFDTATGALYRIEGKKAFELARGIDPRAYAVAGGRIFYVLEGTLHSRAIAREN